MKVKFTLNGKPVELDVNPRETLINTLRLRLRIKSVKRGCERGECGACTVLINGNPVVSCILLTIQVNGAEISTIEGLTGDILFEKLVKNFIESGAVQCGFCTPGILLTAYAGIKQGKIRNSEDAKEYVSNLCRCTGYVKIIEAIAKTASEVWSYERRV